MITEEFEHSFIRHKKDLKVENVRKRMLQYT